MEYNVEEVLGRPSKFTYKMENSGEFSRKAYKLGENEKCNKDVYKYG